MKIVLINPPRIMKLISAAMKPAPPLGLAFIASSLEAAGHTVTVLDCLAEGAESYSYFSPDIMLNGLTNTETAQLIPADTEVIGLSIMFSGNWIQNRTLIDHLGEQFPQATIIAGGEHITSCPEFCISNTKHLSACIVGEGEETVVELIEAIANKTPFSQVQGISYRDTNNTASSTPRRTRIRELNEIPRPAWHLFPLALYQENSIILGVDRGTASLPLLATRGCPYVCTFCSSPQMWGTKYSMRTVADVADEIEEFYHRYGARNFDFYDLTAIIRKQWIIDFCKELLSRKLDITWQIPAGTRSEAIDSEVAYWLRKSGCVNITYAPESGSPETLKAIKKKVNLKDMLRSINHSYKEGMNIKINFIIGFPHEHHSHIWQSIKFLIQASKAGVHDMVPSIFSPYPGSELFKQLQQQGKINIEDDSYFLEIINVDTFFENKFYNTHINKYLLRFYLFLYLFVFYASNYFYHPSRFLKTIKNIRKKTYESRGEMALGELIKRTKIKVKPQQPIQLVAQPDNV
jgi:anaerobic magnesium-protoporphyrin IX monomethyl ester cyclase